MEGVSGEGSREYRKSRDRLSPLSFAEVLTRARTRIEENRLIGILTGEQESKAGWGDLASHHKGYQPKLQLPEGAKIIIGYSTEAPAVTDGAQPGSQGARKVEQITE